ncbi:MAG: 50S ribosomal protein L25 [Planctomycetota bacterium]
MSSSASRNCSRRTKLGSRDSRKLRRAGRIPASLQAAGESAHVNLHLGSVEFLTSRRGHVHLYDLDIEGEVQTAVVRELQWDALGDHIIHVEFKRVQRGVETESEVELAFYGQVEEGVLIHNVTHVTIRSIPSLIPDSIEVKVEGMVSGTHIKAGDLELPEGVSLLTDPELEVAVVGALRVAAVETEETAEDVTLPEGEAPSAPEEDAGEAPTPETS